VIRLAGRPVADKVLADVRAGVERLKTTRGVAPGLAVVLVGDDPASQIYVSHKKRAADAVGITTQDFLYPAGLSQRELLDLVQRLNAERTIHGILIQLPLPTGLDEDAVISAMAPAKDVDGLHPENLGRLLAGAPTTVPCTPAGCIEILDHYGAALSGAEAVVVGRSRLVGKPLAQLLLARHATVTMCHTRTRDLASHTRRADILCVAAGRPRMITGDMVKPGGVGHRRRREPAVDRRPGRRRRLRAGGRARGRGHAGARRRRPDDHRHAHAQHPAGRRAAARRPLTPG
jgi:methylenetetrahydrofolate dehydrogenase (NADP+)/methenyltetrahydrofolate cyclohydrolase